MSKVWPLFNTDGHNLCSHCLKKLFLPHPGLKDRPGELATTGHVTGQGESHQHAAEIPKDILVSKDFFSSHL